MIASRYFSIYILIFHLSNWMGVGHNFLYHPLLDLDSLKQVTYPHLDSLFSFKIRVPSVSIFHGVYFPYSYHGWASLIIRSGSIVYL